MTRSDKPTSFRLAPELKMELSQAADEQAITFHSFVISVLNNWLSNRLKTKAKPDEGILK